MTPSSPQKLGRYEVLEEIGKGAMGVVYLARDPLIGRLVALKTFRVGFSTRDQELQQFRSRFGREAQSAGILSHPNIVTIHDVVDDGADGICFIAMEYVKGTNLTQLLQRPEPFTTEFLVEIVSQIAEALDYAHSRGVVHRDIKPANILITPDEKVKITDFGIARLDTSNLTMEGQLLGTPNYMAPAQIQQTHAHTEQAHRPVATGEGLLQQLPVTVQITAGPRLLQGGLAEIMELDLHERLVRPIAGIQPRQARVELPEQLRQLLQAGSQIRQPRRFHQRPNRLHVHTNKCTKGV